MCISEYYIVHCTRCGREAPEGCETKTGALTNAKADGFIRKKVQNGSYWDFCPKCQQREIDEAKESE